MSIVIISLTDQDDGIAVELSFTPPLPKETKSYTDAQKAGAIMLEALHNIMKADPKEVTVEIVKP